MKRKNKKTTVTHNYLKNKSDNPSHFSRIIFTDSSSKNNTLFIAIFLHKKTKRTTSKTLIPSS